MTFGWHVIGSQNNKLDFPVLIRVFIYQIKYYKYFVFVNLTMIDSKLEKIW